ncbi:related to SYF1-member of the NineTeen Complex involved in splicing [Sporisorium reilianum f. sp. reilianum]|uniref:Pre-mRNA-splicing factor SYF1 n=1 Tax=Sporisorium reilianum f. sp. reilianum TaxID=72559 RepID=A0A2N8UH54_9BASI|nr:related to SYF1-member of the NineTeen Complex involved in splicing [Sporisorium reilianum f. sp. reilianum]
MPPKKRSARTAAAASPEAADDSTASSPLQDALTMMESLFPITTPFPDPATDDTIIPVADTMLEQELLRNPDNFRSWSSYIDHIVDTNVVKRPPPDVSLSAYQASLLGPLASSTQRIALRRITSIYERALAQFPTRYSLWRDYLQNRSRFVLGEPKGGFEAKRKRDLQAAREKLDFGPTLIDSPDDEDFGATYKGGLDGTVGWQEWKSLAALYERALMWLPTMPRLWLSYLSMFIHPQCPPTLSHTHARRTFDRALRTLPGSLHLRVWKIYLKWAERQGGETCLRVWRRYLRVDPSLTERYVSILLAQKDDQEEDDQEQEEDDQQQRKRPGSKALEASKLLLGLARGATDGSYISPEGKSPYQLFIEWLELTEKYPEEIGLDPEEEKQALPTIAAGTSANGTKRGETKAAAAARQTAKGSSTKQFETDPLDPNRLNVTAIIQNDGLDKFTDQSGRLWTGLATYWIKRGEFEVARDTFEAGIKAVKTVRDFTQIFDAYAETSENVIAFMMDELAEDDDDADEEGEEQTREEKEAELDRRMQEFEELMERRPFLVNDVLLRRNPDDVQEWEKRVVLYGDNDEKIIETYREAIQKINPRKATANFHQMFLNFAHFYEYGGSAGVAKLSADGEDGEDGEGGAEPAEPAEGDLESARKIFEKAVTIPFRRVDDLAEIWCEWAEMELRHSNYDEAIRIMARSVAPPRNTKGIQYHDDTLPPQTRLFKSLKLWSFYVDLEESLGDVESTKRVYEKMLELKIASAQIIINYAAFLEDNRYFEESFKVYERGVELFTYPVAFEIWNVYLSKFVKRYGGGKLERARDLFEQALDKCPARFCKPLMLMYGQLEEEHGLAKRAMKIYDRATRAVATDDRFDMFVFYLAKAAANFGLAATRPIYERAIESLPDRQTADMCVRFAELERKLGEIDRARAIYAHASQFCDPRTQTGFWKQWNQFEIETGSEDTFREMLRIKRSVQAQFNTDVSYIAASALASAQRSQAQTAAEGGSSGADSVDANDPMAQVEAASRATGVRQTAFVAASTAASGARAAAADAANGDGSGENKNDQVVGGDDQDDDDLL